jgi:hypothetical protein
MSHKPFFTQEQIEFLLGEVREIPDYVLDNDGNDLIGTLQRKLERYRDTMFEEPLPDPNVRRQVQISIEKEYDANALMWLVTLTTTEHTAEGKERIVSKHQQRFFDGENPQVQYIDWT